MHGAIPDPQVEGHVASKQSHRPCHARLLCKQRAPRVNEIEWKGKSCRVQEAGAAHSDTGEANADVEVHELAPDGAQQGLLKSATAVGAPTLSGA
eukprot:1157664-Pelagomonas_calceolata.AAC.1